MRAAMPILAAGRLYVIKLYLPEMGAGSSTYWARWRVNMAIRHADAAIALLSSQRARHRRRMPPCPRIISLYE